jgi:hypothetical protein
MRLSELTIDVDRLNRVIERKTQRAAPSVNGTGRRSSSSATVSAEVIAGAMGANEGCRCEELGLRAGMPARELVELGSGCTGQTIDGRTVGGRTGAGWVCNALDTIRRRYGL